MHVLRAIRQGIQAWEQDVTLATIQSCWRRSQCIDYGSFPTLDLNSNRWTESEETINQIRDSLLRMRVYSIIQAVPNIHEYISPYSSPQNEQVNDTRDLNNLVDKIIEENTQQEVDLKEEEGQLYLEPLPLVSHYKALHTLHILQRYEEEFKHSDGELLKVLQGFKRDLARRYRDSLHQVTLDSFWSRQDQSEGAKPYIFAY